MRCCIAKGGGQSISGGWLYCLNWGIEQVKDDFSLVVKIYSVRAGEKQGRVIAEITGEGLKLIKDGRHVPLRKQQGVVYGKV